jgi:hypothetical protein
MSNAIVRNAPPHNNGMHPTRDTTDFIFLQRLGRAGDAGRYASVE